MSKCDELNAHKADVTIPVYGTIADAQVYLKEKVDEAIAELKETHKTEVKELLCLIRDKDNNFERAFESEEKELRTTIRALWIMTAEWANAMCLASCNIAAKFMSRDRFEVSDDYREKTIKKYRHRQVVFAKYADYCRAKAENPQNPKARNKKPLRRDVIRGERLDEDCKRANTTVECGKCLCYGLLDNAENPLDKCKKCKAYVWNDEDVNRIGKDGK